MQAVGVLARSSPLEFTMVEEKLENIGHDTENHLELAKVGRTAQFQYSMAPLTVSTCFAYSPRVAPVA